MTAKATFELHAELRQDQGKGASRRLRRTQDKIPAIVYGGGEKPTSITLDHKKVMHALENKAFYSHILTLHIDGKKQKAVLKDLQRHHFKKPFFIWTFTRKCNRSYQYAYSTPFCRCRQSTWCFSRWYRESSVY